MPLRLNASPFRATIINDEEAQQPYRISRYLGDARTTLSNPLPLHLRIHSWLANTAAKYTSALRYYPNFIARLWSIDDLFVRSAS
jgi:hypothetical protein